MYGETVKVLSHDQTSIEGGEVPDLNQADEGGECRDSFCGVWSQISLEKTHSKKRWSWVSNSLFQCQHPQEATLSSVMFLFRMKSQTVNACFGTLTLCHTNLSQETKDFETTLAPFWLSNVPCHKKELGQTIDLANHLFRDEKRWDPETYNHIC